MLTDEEKALLLIAEDGLYLHMSTQCSMWYKGTWDILVGHGYIEPKTRYLPGGYIDTHGRQHKGYTQQVIITDLGIQYLDTLTAQEKVDIAIQHASHESYLYECFAQLTIEELPKYLASEHENIRKLAKARLEELQRG